MSKVLSSTSFLHKLKYRYFIIFFIFLYEYLKIILIKGGHYEILPITYNVCDTTRRQYQVYPNIKIIHRDKTLFYNDKHLPKRAKITTTYLLIQGSRSYNNPKF